MTSHCTSDIMSDEIRISVQVRKIRIRIVKLLYQCGDNIYE